jgi:hypothetical protein
MLRSFFPRHSRFVPALSLSPTRFRAFFPLQGSFRFPLRIGAFRRPPWSKCLPQDHTSRLSRIRGIVKEEMVSVPNVRWRGVPSSKLDFACNSEPRRGGLAKPGPTAWERRRSSRSSPEGATYEMRIYHAPSGLDAGNEIRSYGFHPGRWPGLC